MHLWEAKHSYYCNEGNYFASESVGSEYKSFADFLEEWSDADKDYNLLFRWDWIERDDETDEPTYNGDDNYRNGKLKLFYMGQRKGKYVYSVVDVCRADEPAVIAFLKPHWDHMRGLWSPIDA